MVNATTKIIFPVFVALFGFGLKAQTITPFVICSGGGFGSVSGTSITFTTGQPAGSTLSNTGNFITQGFNQPQSIMATPPPGTDTVLIIHNAITPNGDGMNDIWILDFLDSTDNHVFIYNRWGNLIWEGKNYNNTTIVWDGTTHDGSKLPTGTYFYFITTDRSSHKGWVEL
jgi:gliding motility-associated-like protein